MSINSQNNDGSCNNNNAEKLRKTEQSRNYAVTDKKFHSQMNDMAKVNHWNWMDFFPFACVYVFFLYSLRTPTISYVESYVYVLNVYTQIESPSLSLSLARVRIALSPYCKLRLIPRIIITGHSLELKSVTITTATKL